MAGIKSFVKQIDPGNRDVTQTQSNVNTAVQQIANSPIINGVVIKDVEFVGTIDTVVNHKLGREPIGYIIIGGTGALGQTLIKRYIDHNQILFLEKLSELSKIKQSQHQIS